jgi:hypothetical protein
MAPLVRAVATSGATTGTSQTFTKPAGTVNGDLMVLHLIINGTAQPDTSPSGWTKGDEITGGSQLHQFWYKQAGGSEPASYDFTWAASVLKGGGTVTVRSDASLLLGINTYDKQTNTSSTNRQCPSVTPTIASQLIMFIGASIAQAMTPDAGSTEQYDTGLTLRLYCMTEAVAAGATGTRTATGASNATSKTFTIAVSEQISNGAANLALGALTLSATGTVAVKGSASLTLGALTLAATGNVASTAVLGSANLTLAALTLSAAGVLAPDAPTSLTATPISGSRIDLTWVDNDSRVAAYSVERSTSEFSGFSEIDVTTDKFYSSTGLAQNTRYWFRVRAIKA